MLTVLYFLLIGLGIFSLLAKDYAAMLEPYNATMHVLVMLYIIFLWPLVCLYMISAAKSLYTKAYIAITLVALLSFLVIGAVYAAPPCCSLLG